MAVCTETTKMCSVKGKIGCIFKSKVVASVSNKRKEQLYKVVASDVMDEEFMRGFLEGGFTATEKFDGTCCLVDHFNGRPWLWARHDVKPNKAADKRFKAYQQKKNEHLLNDRSSEEEYIPFQWNAELDFKEKPDNWKPASGVSVEDVQPDKIGHLVGFVPVDPSLRTHLWHLSAVDFNRGEAAVLSDNKNNSLKIHLIKLADNIGKTFELIGTHVNANPYGIGCKQTPIHLLVQHGSFDIDRTLFEYNKNDLTRDSMEEFFMRSQLGRLEGIVWHGIDGSMFKLHRCHLDLPWPVKPLMTSQKSVTVEMDDYEVKSCYEVKLFSQLNDINGRTFEKLTDIFKPIQ